MRILLATIVFFLFMGCSSTPDEINTAMKPFMLKNFPEATYNTVAENNVYRLVIDDKGKLITKDNIEPLMTETLGQFFLSFYKTSNSKAIDSKLMVDYKSDKFTWESEKHSFSELGKMFRIQEK